MSDMKAYLLFMAFVFAVFMAFAAVADSSFERQDKKNQESLR